MPSTPSARPGRDRLARSLRELLVGPTPAAVLQRIADRDPLDLRSRIAGRLAHHSLLLDTERVYLRSLALCAWKSSDYRGSLGLARWIQERIDEAIADVLADPAGAGGRHLADLLQVSPAEARRAAASFNARPGEERTVFFDLFVEGTSLDLLARQRGESLTHAARLGRAGLEALLSTPEGEA